MYDYQSYLSGNRSLLGAQGPGYEYAPQFPSHLRQWQEQGYDTAGISAFSPTYRRKRRSQTPGYQPIMSPGGVVDYRYQQPGQRQLPGFFGGQQGYPSYVAVGRGQAPPSYASYQQPRYGYF